MIKRSDGDLIRLVTQPDHAALSGYLAAHWGNAAFQPLGCWDEAPETEILRREIVFGIAEHDNGWWEWEADPEIDPADGLPLDFLQGSDSSGFERWKRGAARFETEHPIASLLINRHAYWLQAARISPIREPQFRHPLFGFRPHVASHESPEAAALREFLVERLSHERVLLNRLAAAGRPWRAATRDATLLPAVRLLQVLDTISLAICGGDPKPLTLLEVPRQGWSDRTTIELEWQSDKEVRITPYPFARTPLPIHFPARLVEPNAWLHDTPPTLLSLTLI